VLGTVVASVTFPAFPVEIDKDTLITLTVFFGLLAVVGPFIFECIRHASADQSGLQGYNGTLLIAFSVTLAAVLGELGALGLLFWEILSGGALGWVAVVAAGLACILAVIYFGQTAPDAVSTDWAKDAEESTNETRAYYVGVIQDGIAPPLMVRTPQGTLDELVGARDEDAVFAALEHQFVVPVRRESSCSVVTPDDTLIELMEAPDEDSVRAALKNQILVIEPERETGMAQFRERQLSPGAPRAPRRPKLL
jgi:hypothetical protein